MNLAVAMRMNQNTVAPSVCAPHRFVDDVVVVPTRHVSDRLAADRTVAALLFPEVGQDSSSSQGFFHLYAKAFFKIDFLLSLPIGLELYLKEPFANALKLPYHSRSALARRIVDQVAAALPTRTIHVATDGGYATQAFLRALPSNVEVVGRFLLTGVL
jgi:hypothetical protein